MKPTFFEVARRPKWIAGLLLAMIAAGIFAGLMQWQIDRTFVEVGISEEEQQPAPLSEFAIPGEVFPGAYDRLATATVTLDAANSYIVENRLQLVAGEQVAGYWLISNSFEESTGASLTLALAFSTDPESLLVELPEESLQITGYVQPSDPIRQGEQYLGSASLAELVNLYFEEPTPSYPVYLIVQQGVELPLEQISIGIRQQEIEINWLTAFYAVEWAFFALAAFYLWWRLVKDQMLREAAL